LGYELVPHVVGRGDVQPLTVQHLAIQLPLKFSTSPWVLSMRGSIITYISLFFQIQDPSVDNASHISGFAMNFSISCKRKPFPNTS
jgi:hypothetical protein